MCLRVTDWSENLLICWCCGWLLLLFLSHSFISIKRYWAGDLYFLQMAAGCVEISDFRIFWFFPHIKQSVRNLSYFWKPNCFNAILTYFFFNLSTIKICLHLFFEQQKYLQQHLLLQQHYWTAATYIMPCLNNIFWLVFSQFFVFVGVCPQIYFGGINFFCRAVFLWQFAWFLAICPLI